MQRSRKYGHRTASKSTFSSSASLRNSYNPVQYISKVCPSFNIMLQIHSNNTTASSSLTSLLDTNSVDNMCSGKQAFSSSTPSKTLLISDSAVCASLLCRDPFSRTSPLLAAEALRLKAGMFRWLLGGTVTIGRRGVVVSASSIRDSVVNIVSRRDSVDAAPSSAMASKKNFVGSLASRQALSSSSSGRRGLPVMSTLTLALVLRYRLGRSRVPAGADNIA
mmetsp:Transcript_39272/g.68003  ORF Transcript_39272/g.68003 Transcript_39272/m.68003 type:complete len:221 (-) Transcript_39272:891-1553(-)